MRDYIKVAVVIVHDAADDNAPRFGAYFGTIEEAIAYRDDIENTNPGFYAYDVFGWRWFGWNKNALIQTMNSAYNTTFNYVLFVQGYDGYAAEQNAELYGRGLVITLESPRKAGFNSLVEKARGGTLTFAT